MQVIDVLVVGYFNEDTNTNNIQEVMVETMKLMKIIEMELLNKEESAYIIC